MVNILFRAEKVLIMSTKYLFLIFICSVIVSTFAEDDSAEAASNDDTSTAESNVVVLTSSNFDSVLTANKYVLVEFYAPWCGHCKKLEPEYEKAATILKEKGSDAVLAKCDATEEEAIGNEFNVQGFPTLKFFQNGDRDFPTDFNADRVSSAIVDEVLRLTDPNYVPPPSAVHTLTSENFDEFVSAELSLVLFHAPWCTQCKHMAPDYELAAEQLKAWGTPIPLGKIDASKESDIAEKFDITGFPTALVFRKGKAYPFEISRYRDAVALNDAMRRQSEPSSVEVSDVGDFKFDIDRADSTVVALFSENDKESDFHKYYMEASMTMQDELQLKHSYDPKIAQYLDVKKTPALVIVTPKKFQSKYEPKVKSLYDLTKPWDVEEFVLKNRLPLIGEYSMKSHVYEKSKPLIVVYYEVDFDSKEGTETQYWRQKLLPLAHKYKGKLTFAVANEQKCEKDLKRADLSESGNEINAIIYDKEGFRYPFYYDDDFSESLLAEFIEDWFAGKVKSYSKSAKPPKKQTTPVLTAVAHTFKDLVESETKDALVYFYNGPKCKTCVMEFDKQFANFADKMKSDNSLILAKFDFSKNDPLPKFKPEEKTAPTVYFIPRGKNTKPVLLLEKPSVGALERFLTQQRNKIENLKQKDEL